MAATLATVSALLKEIYEPRLRKQLEDSTVALKRIEKSSEGVESKVGGRYVTFAIHTRRNSGIGARREMELLPTPGHQKYAAARVGLKYLYGGIQLSGQTIELADKDYQSFASALDQEVSGLKDDLAKDQNRQVYGSERGSFATATAATTTANTFTANNDNGVMYVQDGMQVDIIDGTTLNNPSPTVKASDREVLSVDTDTNVVTLSGAAFSVAVGDVMVRHGNVNREWIGFEQIISNTGKLYDIDPTDERVWKSEVSSNGGTKRALSEGLMVAMADRIRARGGKTTAIFQNLGVRRAYWNLLVQQRQYTNTKEFAGGFSGLTFTTDQGEIPVVVDVDAPKNKQYFVDEKNLTVYREGDWSFMNRDGSMWQRVTGYDAYEARMFQYSEIGCHRRNTHGVIHDISEPAAE